MTHIALLGLSADPPHLGHLAVAQAVKSEGYDQVWFLITPHNPFKNDAALSYWHRRQLARLLIADEPDVEVSDFEAGIAVKHEDTRTHTVLAALHRRMPEVNFTFVMGADAWSDAEKGFHTWKNFKLIPKLAGLLVMPRHPYTSNVFRCPAARALAQLHQVGHKPVPRGHWRLSGKLVNHLASSTQVREELATTGTSTHLTPAQLNYLRKHKLCGL